VDRQRYVLIVSVLLGILGIISPTPAFAAGTGANGGSGAITTARILANAASLLGIRYRWGGTTMAGLDCSAYLSRAWEVSRQTTDTLAGVAHPISEDALQPGDALDLTTAQDPRHRGHVRLFAGWVDTSHTWVWVYEEARPRAVYHAIPYDPRYTPLRRDNYQPTDVRALAPPLLLPFPLDLADPRLTYSLWS